jgi:hypothetical protein
MSRKTPKKPRAPLNDYDLGPVLISGVEPPLEGDTESDGALGARHVEHNLEVLLLTFPEIVLDTEIPKHLWTISSFNQRTSVTGFSV